MHIQYNRKQVKWEIVEQVHGLGKHHCYVLAQFPGTHSGYDRAEQQLKEFCQALEDNAFKQVFSRKEAA